MIFAKNNLLRAALLLVLGIFVFQTMDIPPLGHFNLKTCCGRFICACTHAKGAFCDYKHKHSKDHVVKKPLDSGWTKAPCHSNTPKTALPGYAKEFYSPVSSFSFIMMGDDFIPANALALPPQIETGGIDRPPRLI